MTILHFCAGLEGWNGMANTARQFVAEEIAAGHSSRLINRVEEIAGSIDVIEIHGAWLPVVHRAAKRAKAIGAKLIIRPAGSYDPVRRRFRGWKKCLMAPWEHAMLRRADVVQATCPQEAEWIREYHPGAKIELIDLKRFFHFKPVLPLERPLNRPLRVLYLGRRHPLKGVEFLEHAVSNLNRTDLSDTLVQLRIVSNHFGEELERDWDWCDVLCLPTLSENFGRVVAEALERGKRVIVTDGAPAWEPEEGKAERVGGGGEWRDRLVYLKGYRDGSDEERVRILKDALAELIGIVARLGMKYV